MTKKEFIDRTGINPSDEDFFEINLMYCESGESIDKNTFCDEYVKYRNSRLLNVFYQRCIRLSDKCDIFRSGKKQAADLLLIKAEKYNDYDMYRQAVKMIGQQAVIKRKLELKLDLWDDDKTYIIENIK